MDSTAIIVACITALGGLLVAVVTSARRENRRDHGETLSVLRLIHKTVSRVEDRVDGHLTWHTKGVDDGQSKERDSKLTK